MEYREFSEYIRDNLTDYLPESYKDASVELLDVQKMNGSYEGISVRMNGSQIAPTANLKRFYELYDQEGYSMDEIMHQMADGFTAEVPKFQVEGIERYEEASKQLYVRVSGLDKNRDTLQNRPYTIQEDLAITYHLDLGHGGSVQVTNDLMKTWGVTQAQLHEDAMTNAARIHPAYIENLSTVLSQMMGGGEDMGFGDNGLTLVSNRDMVEGASALFYPGTMETIAEQMGDSFYILPSSVHEQLVLPEKSAPEVDELRKMVTEINMTQVSPEEQVTDNVYHYDSKNKLFEKADTYLGRLLKGAEKEQDGRISFFVTDHVYQPLEMHAVRGLTLENACRNYETWSQNAEHPCGIGFELSDGSKYTHPFVMMADGEILEKNINRVSHFKESPLVQKAVTDLKERMGDKVRTKDLGKTKSKSGAVL